MSPSDHDNGTTERRERHALRALIDEMLGQLRAATNGSELWTPEARARAQADLERIMASVRREALGERGSAE